MKNIAVTLCVALPILLAGAMGCGEKDTPLPQPDPENPAGGETISPDVPIVPDEPADDASICGHIRCNGNPVEGVVVSDGISVTLSDSQGYYSIKSDKSTGYVFISVPGDYTVTADNNIPAIHQPLSLPADQREIHDFNLLKASNSSYTLLIHADHHLANRTEDISQFKKLFIPDANAIIADRQSKGRNVYSISLGDISWEQFWTSNNFGLKDAVDCLSSLSCPVYHTIGNHDNNPYISGDWGSADLFRTYISPTYYSFNIGEIHYVVLDDVIYNNPGASSSTMGDRSYDRAVPQSQLEWLKADLGVIADKSTPLVICAHVPFMGDPSLAGQTALTKRNLLNMQEIESVLSDFSNITFFSGHYHRNYTVISQYDSKFMEHNVAAVCGTLWWTGKSGYAGNHLCTDGSPGGYGILEVDGRSIKYSYKGLGKAEDYQFRVYDLNTTRINEASVTNSSHKNKVSDYAGEYYSAATPNGILINVFNWGPDWKIEVSEEGNPLSVTRVKAKDPLHILSYECQRLSHGAIPTSTSTLMTQNSIHFFKAVASKATSTITIKVTDANGREYIQTMTRPKAFTLDMN